MLECVHDVSGRLIDMLFEGSQAPGRYVVRWDGTDSSGRPVAVGIYFLSLTADDRTETRRVVHIR